MLSIMLAAFAALLIFAVVGPPGGGPLTGALPRADVSNGALAGALVGVLMLVMAGNTDLASYGVFATLVLQAGLAYLLPAALKYAASALAGAVVIVVVSLYSFASGLPYDAGALQTAATAIVTFVLTLALPAKQP